MFSSAVVAAAFVAGGFSAAVHRPHSYSGLSAGGSSSPPVRFSTWNLRYDSKPNNITVAQTLATLPDPIIEPNFMNYTGEQPWSTRRIPVAQTLVAEGGTLAGFQESLIRQVNDVQTLLGDGWQWCGVGRDDGQWAGEFNPLFWSTADWTLNYNETFWLSNTPFTPSKYPGAGSYRIANVGSFTPVAGGQTFTWINTHLDDQSEAGRMLGASMILWRARYAAAVENAPVFITGDFNSYQTGEQSQAYQIVTGEMAPVALPASFKAKYPIPSSSFPDFVMTDLRAAVPRVGAMGSFRTFTGFPNPMGQADYGRIDYAFGGNNGGWDAIRYNTAATITDSGILASDHRPVYVDVTLNAPSSS